MLAMTHLDRLNPEQRCAVEHGGPDFAAAGPLLVADGVTVLLTTQYLDEADQLADDIVVVDHGRIIATGTPGELKAKAGAQTLAVRPVDPEHLATVVTLVESATGGKPAIEDLTVTVPVTDPAVMPTVVRRLDDLGVLIGEARIFSIEVLQPDINESGVYFTPSGAAAGARDANHEHGPNDSGSWGDGRTA